MSLLTKGDLKKGLLLTATPIVVSNLLQSVLEVVDLFFVGRLGLDAIAGVALSGTIIMLLMTLIIGINTATGAFVSRYFGAGDFSNVGRTIVNALFLGLLFSLAVSVVGILFSEDLLSLLGADEAVVAFGTSYLTVLFMGLFTMVELWIISSSFQSCGDVRTPMLLMAGANLINLVLDPVFIFGFGVIPALGVAGAALSTVFSRGVGLTVALFLLLRMDERITFEWRGGMDINLMARLMRVGVPNMIQSGGRSVGAMLMMAIVGLFGTAAISAYGIACRVEMLALMPGFGIATATAVLVGQNLGANRPDRAEKATWLSVALYGTFMVVISVLYYLFSPEIMEFFDPSGMSTEIGVSYFNIFAPFYVLLGSMIILSFALDGAGDTRRPMYATLICAVAIEVPLAWILSVPAGIGISGVWLAMVVSVVVQIVILLGMFRSGKWKGTVI